MHWLVTEQAEGHLLLLTCWVVYKRSQKSFWLSLPVFLSLIKIKFMFMLLLACSKIGSAIDRLHVKEKGLLLLLFK